MGGGKGGGGGSFAVSYYTEQNEGVSQIIKQYSSSSGGYTNGMIQPSFQKLKAMFASGL